MPEGANPYLKGGIDTNDILRAKLDPELYEGYCIGIIHKRLHQATSRYRQDPRGRVRQYRSVLYYAQQLFEQFAPTAPTYGNGIPNGAPHGGPTGAPTPAPPPTPAAIDFDDLAQRFQRLPTQTTGAQQPSQLQQTV